MLTPLQKRLHLPSPAMVVGLIALVFAMTGYAAAQVVPNPLPAQNPQTSTIRTAEGATGATVECLPGERATGGGGDVSQSSGSFAHLYRSRPGPGGPGNPSTGWVAAGSRPDGTLVPVTAYVICEK